MREGNPSAAGARTRALMRKYANGPGMLDALNAIAILDAGWSGAGGAGTRPTLTSLVLARLRTERGWARPKPALTLGAMFDMQIDSYSAQQGRAAAAMRGAKRRFCRALGESVTVEKVTADMVKSALRGCRAPATCNRALALLKTAGRRAVRAGLAQNVPGEGVEERTVPWREPEFFAPERVEKIMRKCEKHPGAADSGIGAFLTLGFFVGARTAEILRARWDDIDLKGGVLRIPRPKGWTRGAKPRIVELENNAAAWLETWRAWTLKHGGAAAVAGRIVRDAHDIQRWKERHLKRAGLSWGNDSGHNAMRHTFATMHVAAFRDAAATALSLGHSGGTAILEKHYRGLVAKSVAQQYWRIEPSARGPAAPEARPGRGRRTDLATAAEKAAAAAKAAAISRVPTLWTPRDNPER
ncbi:MAG: site-specific integrase [Kiritimatiellae bacterium]|nr:site-specific integrase [Kiritimatiellia bacterium]